MLVKPNPRRLILNMMVAAGDVPFGARNAVDACALFGVAENSARVTLARLSTEGLIESSGRGMYQLTEHAHRFAADALGWRDAMKRLKAWKGDWVAVHASELKRSDRSALRQRERAIELNGLRELNKDLYLRPNNLKGGVEGVRQRLYKLGLEEQAAVFVLSQLDPDREARAKGLWQSLALTRRYQETAQALEKWLDRADKLEPDVAARESFVIGDKAIRQMVFDPLLPDDLVDAGARQAFFDVLLRYDLAGRKIWQQLYGSVQ